MATAILSSGSSLNHRFDHDTLIHRNHSRLRRHSYASTTTAPSRLKRSPTTSKKMVVSPAVKTNLVMGQVKILKRGETLSAFCNSVDPVVASTNKIRPEPETLQQKQIGEIVSGRYAGACSSASPPPSSLPIPCFLVNKLLA